MLREGGREGVPKADTMPYNQPYLPAQNKIEQAALGYNYLSWYDYLKIRKSYCLR